MSASYARLQDEPDVAGADGASQHRGLQTPQRVGSSSSVKLSSPLDSITPANRQSSGLWITTVETPQGAIEAAAYIPANTDSLLVTNNSRSGGGTSGNGSAPNLGHGLGGNTAFGGVSAGGLAGGLASADAFGSGLSFAGLKDPSMDADARSQPHIPSIGRASTIPVDRATIDWRVTVPKFSRYWMRCTTKGWIYILAGWTLLFILGSILGSELYRMTSSYNPSRHDFDAGQSNLLLEKNFPERIPHNYMFISVWAPPEFEIRQEPVYDVMSKFRERLSQYEPKGIFKEFIAADNYRGYFNSILATEFLGPDGNSMAGRIIFDTTKFSGKYTVISPTPQPQEVIDFQVWARDQLNQILSRPVKLYPSDFSYSAARLKDYLQDDTLRQRVDAAAVFNDTSLPSVVADDLRHFDEYSQQLQRDGVAPLTHPEYHNPRLNELLSLTEYALNAPNPKAVTSDLRLLQDTIAQELCDTAWPHHSNESKQCMRYVKSRLQNPLNAAKTRKFSAAQEPLSTAAVASMTNPLGDIGKVQLDAEHFDQSYIDRLSLVGASESAHHVAQDTLLRMDAAAEDAKRVSEEQIRILRESIEVATQDDDDPDDDGAVDVMLVSRVTSIGLLHHDTAQKQRTEGWKIFLPVILIVAVVQALFLDNLRIVGFSIYAQLVSVTASFLFLRMSHNPNIPVPIFGITLAIALSSATSFHISTLFFWRLSNELKRARGMHFVHDALLVTLARIGKPVLVTCLFSCVSFATLAIHPPSFCASTALLSVIVVLLSNLATISILPAFVVALPFYFARKSSFPWPCRLYCRGTCCAIRCSAMCNKCQEACFSDEDPLHDWQATLEQRQMLANKKSGSGAKEGESKPSKWRVAHSGAVTADPFETEREKMREASEYLTQLKNPYLVYYNASHAADRATQLDGSSSTSLKTKKASLKGSEHTIDAAAATGVVGFSAAFADPSLHAKVPDPTQLRQHAAVSQQRLSEQQLQLCQAIQDPSRVYIPEGGGQDEYGYYDANGWYYYYLDVPVQVSKGGSSQVNLFDPQPHSTEKKVRMYFYYESDDPADLPSHPANLLKARQVPQHDPSLATKSSSDAPDLVAKLIQQELELLDTNEDVELGDDAATKGDTFKPSGSEADECDASEAERDEDDELAGYRCLGCFLCLCTRKRCLHMSTGYTSCFEDVYHSCMLLWYQRVLRKQKEAKMNQILTERKNRLREQFKPAGNVQEAPASPTRSTTKSGKEYTELSDPVVTPRLPMDEAVMDEEIAAAYADAKYDPNERRGRRRRKKNASPNKMTQALSNIDESPNGEVSIVSPIVREGRQQIKIKRTSEGEYLIRADSTNRLYRSSVDLLPSLSGAKSAEEEAAAETYISFTPASGAIIASIRRCMRFYWCKCCHPSDEDLRDDIGRQLAFQAYHIDEDDDARIEQELASAAIQAVYADAALTPSASGTQPGQSVNADEQATVATAIMMQQLGLLDEHEELVVSSSESDLKAVASRSQGVLAMGGSAASVSDSLIGLDITTNASASTLELRQALTRHALRQSEGKRADADDPSTLHPVNTSLRPSLLEGETAVRLSSADCSPYISSLANKSSASTISIGFSGSTWDDADQSKAPLLAPAPHLLATRYDPVNCFNYHRYLIADRDREEETEMVFLRALDRRLGINESEIAKQAEDDAALDSLDFEEGLGLGGGGDMGHRLAGVKMTATEEALEIAREEASKAAAAAAEAVNRIGLIKAANGSKKGPANGTARSTYVAENASMLLHQAARPKTLTSTEVEAARYRQSTSLWYRVARLVTNRNFAFPLILLFLAVTGPVALHSHLLDTRADSWLVFSRDIQSRVELRAMQPSFPQSTIFPNFILQIGPQGYAHDQMYFEYCYILANKLLEEGVVTILEFESLCFVTNSFVSYDLSQRYLSDGSPESSTADGFTYRVRYQQYSTQDGVATFTILRPDLDTFGPDEAAWLHETEVAIDKARHIIERAPASLVAGGNTIEVHAGTRLGESYSAQILIIVVTACILSLFSARSLFAPVKVLVTSLVCLSWVAGLSEIVFQEGLARAFYTKLSHMLHIHWMVPPLVISTTFALSFQFEFLFHLHTLEFRKLGYTNRVSTLKSIYNMGGMLIVSSVIMCAFYAALTASSQGILNQYGFVICAAIIMDVIFVTLFLSPALKALAGDTIWWPLRLGPPMMDSNAFAELEPFDPSTKLIKSRVPNRPGAALPSSNVTHPGSQAKVSGSPELQYSKSNLSAPDVNVRTDVQGLGVAGSYTKSLSTMGSVNSFGAESVITQYYQDNDDMMY